MSNPLDEYLEMRKQAFFGSAVAKTMAARVGSGALEAMGGAAILSLGGAAMKTISAVRKKREFSAMLQANPDLAEFHGENPSQFNQHYSSFRSMNPHFAQDPIVSGTYMRQMSMSPSSAGKVIVDSLAGARGLPPSMMERAGDMYRPTDPADFEKLRLEIAERKGKVEAAPYNLAKTKAEIPVMQEKAHGASQRMRLAAQQMGLPGIG